MLTITMTRSTYRPTKHGWSSVPTSTTTENVSEKFYRNCVDAIPFFNGFFGGKAYGRKHYTVYGYVIDVITLINPNRDEKTVDCFTFKYVEEEN